MTSHEAWFSFEEIPLKWHYPLGLLNDLFSGTAPYQASGPSLQDPTTTSEAKEGPLPWRLTLHFTDWPDEQLVRLDAEGRVLHDAFINSVKEADFLRNGTAKGIMSLSKDDSTRLWTAVQDRMYIPLFVHYIQTKLMGKKLTQARHYLENFAVFSPISQKLLYAQGALLRHIPLKVYLPSSPTASSPTAGSHLRVVQSLVTPTVSGTRELQTLGSALHMLLPALFPSRRTPILAKPVLHGAVVPMGALVEELLRGAAYLDGWLHLGVVMIG